MEIDPQTLDTNTIYKILKGTVVPRPIGWVSTLSAAGVANLAPFSFFTVASRKPPIVSLSILSRGEGPSAKDTLANIQETRAFTVNVVSYPLVDAMHLTATEAASDVDEFDLAGLERARGSTSNVPRVAAAPVAMECQLEQVLPMGDVGDHVVFGRVLRFHIRDDVWLGDGRINVAAIQPVGRLAVDYCLVDTAFTSPGSGTLSRRSHT